MKDSRQEELHRSVKSLDLSNSSIIEDEEMFSVQPKKDLVILVFKSFFFSFRI